MLSGLVVVDLTRALAGPYAAMMLGDLGARVIKVEPPGGDDTRHWGPPFVGAEGVSTYYLACNRNKESITADLKSEHGREVLTRLVRRADVLIENFRPGVMDRLGFGVGELQALNARLVICSITGFGHDGPEGGRAGYDQIAQGEAGLMSVTGQPGEPTKVGVPIGDLLAGMNSAFGIVSALYERESTGRGRVVRTSLLAGLVGVHAFQGTRWTVAGQVPTASGNHHPAIAPYGVYTAADGIIQLAIGNQSQWKAFAAAISLDVNDPRFATNPSRVDNRDALTAAVEELLQARSADEWLVDFAAAGVPAGRIRTIDQVYEWEQTRSQGLVISVDHPTLGTIDLPGPTLRIDENRYAGGRRDHLPPPVLGEHNDQIARWLSLGGEDHLA